MMNKAHDLRQALFRAMAAGDKLTSLIPANKSTQFVSGARHQTPNLGRSIKTPESSAHLPGVERWMQVNSARGQAAKRLYKVRQDIEITSPNPTGLGLMHHILQEGEVVTLLAVEREAVVIKKHLPQTDRRPTQMYLKERERVRLKHHLPLTSNGRLWYHAEKVGASGAVLHSGLIPVECLEESHKTHYVQIRCADGRQGRCGVEALVEINSSTTDPHEVAQYHEGHLSPSKKANTINYDASRPQKFLTDDSPPQVGARGGMIKSPLEEQLVALPLSGEVVERLVYYSSALHSVLTRASSLKVKSIDAKLVRTLQITERCKLEDTEQILETVPLLRNLRADEVVAATSRALDTLTTWYQSSIERVGNEIVVHLELQQGGVPLALVRNPPLHELALTVRDMGSGTIDTVYLEVAHRVATGRGALSVDYERITWAQVVAALRHTAVVAGVPEYHAALFHCVYTDNAIDSDEKW